MEPPWVPPKGLKTTRQIPSAQTAGKYSQEMGSGWILPPGDIRGVSVTTRICSWIQTFPGDFPAGLTSRCSHLELARGDHSKLGILGFSKKQDSAGCGIYFWERLFGMRLRDEPADPRFHPGTFPTRQFQAKTTGNLGSVLPG